jgi:prepilin-type N-terminal cleavage/methylation domain-containing protein
MKKILSKFKSNKGYTLVELLTVIVVMVVVGLIISTILVSSLRGGNKTSAINEIRDNGNTAMTKISRYIEFAKNFDGVSETGDAGSYFTDCLSSTVLIPTPEVTPVPTRFKFIKVRAFDEGEITISCSGSTIASNGASLIDQSRISSIENDCYFTCSQSYLSQPPTIGINFTLSKGVNTLFFEQKFSTEFHTSVVMRNLGQ